MSAAKRGDGDVVIEAPAEARRRKLPSEKKIRAPEFGRRLTQQLDAMPLVPPMNYGRLAWLQDELKKRFDADVSRTTISKWVIGEVKPTEERLRMLAQILEVSEEWLSLGIAPDMTPRETKIRNATASGAVNLVAGLVSMDGGHPAFPAEDDARAKTALIDLYAIIRGAQYAFHVNLAIDLADGTLKFAVPSNAEDAFQIGVIRGEELTFTLVELSDDLIKEHGKRMGGVVEVVMTPAQVAAARIHGFKNRL